MIVIEDQIEPFGKKKIHRISVVIKYEYNTQGLNPVLRELNNL